MIVEIKKRIILSYIAFFSFFFEEFACFLFPTNTGGIVLGVWGLVSGHMVTGMQILGNLVCPVVRTGTGA